MLVLWRCPDVVPPLDGAGKRLRDFCPENTAFVIGHRFCYLSNHYGGFDTTGVEGQPPIESNPPVNVFPAMLVVVQR